MVQYNDMVQALKDLRQRGYSMDFSLLPDCLYCTSRSLKLKPEDFTVTETHRFESLDSSPDNNAVIYAISSNDSKNKGVLVDAYGTYAEEMTHEMAKKIKCNITFKTPCYEKIYLSYAPTGAKRRTGKMPALWHGIGSRWRCVSFS